ncbi:hypothetical protein IT402_03145 [Candidatus Nomurabacteria bacterium]|nr:hypothetical protein [Candidatus Nomurabacteria bacterium]
MELKAPLILIPWDNLFIDCTKKNHVIVFSYPMANSLISAIKNSSKRIIHQTKAVGLSCFFDSCLDYDDSELEYLYEDTKKCLIKSLVRRGDQEWVFANSLILKEFKLFFSSDYVQYFEQGNIEDPFMLLASDDTSMISFSLPKPKDIIISLQ